MNDEVYKSETALNLLDKSERRLTLIFDALPDIVFKFNEDGDFVDCEEGRKTWLLYPKNQFLGKNISNFLPSTIANETKDKIKLTLETAMTQYLDYELNEDGQTSYFHSTFVKADSEHVFAIVRNVTELKEKQLYIEYLSYHDQMTDLYNRRFFDEELKRYNTQRNLPLTVAAIDINGLKLINDVFGHLQGDELIKKVANVLKEACRSDDVIARVGGDEFLVLLPKTSYFDAETVINRIYEGINRASFGPTIISISAGWESKVHPEEDIHDIFIRAEEHMYRRKLFESQEMRKKTINLIIETLHEKSDYEKFHSEELQKWSRAMAEKLILSEKEISNLEIVSVLHDIGKINVRRSVLLKKGNLTSEEFTEIKRHSESGYHILKSVDALSPLSELVLYHHENWDGSGYPKGIKGEEIPIESRILRVLEAYIAMTSRRTYKERLTHQLALEELHRFKGIQFDPKIVDTFVQLLDENQVSQS